MSILSAQISKLLLKSVKILPPKNFTFKFFVQAFQTRKVLTYKWIASKSGRGGYLIIISFRGLQFCEIFLKSFYRRKIVFLELKA